MNYQLNDAKMFADITDNIAIIINSETGIYYGMNSFATNVYENVASGADIEDILNTLKNLEGAPKDIEVRFNAFLEVMLEKELITEAPKSSAEVNIDKNLALQDNFYFEIKEYNDAQELLLADPIHEVKEDTGWTPEKDSIGYTKEETREREKKMKE